MTRNDEIRAVLATTLDFVPTDDEIEQALAAEPRIEHQAKWWGWRDEEVRTLLADELKREHEWKCGEPQVTAGGSHELRPPGPPARPRWRRLGWYR